MGKKDQPAAEQPQQPQQQQVPLRIKETKKFGITGLEKQTLQNFLEIRAINDFQLRAYLQLVGAARLGIQDGQLVQFDLQLEQNQVEVRYLEPDPTATPQQPQKPSSTLETA